MAGSTTRTPGGAKRGTPKMPAEQRRPQRGSELLHERETLRSAQFIRHLAATHIRRVADDHVELHIASKQLGNPSLGFDFGLAIGTTLRLGDTRIERSWPVLDLHLESGQAVDEALPAGPFDGEFMVTFRAGGRRALLGAELQGGSVILMRDDEVLLSTEQNDHVGIAHYPQARCRDRAGADLGIVSRQQRAPRGHVSVPLQYCRASSRS